jgi:hypothetical protein
MSSMPQVDALRRQACPSAHASTYTIVASIGVLFSLAARLREVP